MTYQFISNDQDHQDLPSNSVADRVEKVVSSNSSPMSSASSTTVAASSRAIRNHAATAAAGLPPGEAAEGARLRPSIGVRGSRRLRLTEWVRRCLPPDPNRHSSSVGSTRPQRVPVAPYLAFCNRRRTDLPEPLRGIPGGHPRRRRSHSVSSAQSCISGRSG